MKTVEIVLPVYNEENILLDNVATLRDFLSVHPGRTWTITIADNASTDHTYEIAQSLSDRYPEVSALHLDEKGRGRALRTAWLQSSACIVAYMDIDLATDIMCFPQLIAAIEEGADIAIGSRLHPYASIKRSFKREMLSRCYNLLIRGMFHVPFHDAQCGFKALRAQTAQQLIPQIKDQEWFFDTELLLLAARQNCRIAELPVTWREKEPTSVHIFSTVVRDIAGLLRMRFS